MLTGHQQIAGWALLLLLLLPACQKSEDRTYDELLTPIYTPRYATGFELLEVEGLPGTVLRVTNPWQGAEGICMDTYIQKGEETPPEGFEGEVVGAHAGRVVALSSSFVGILDHLGLAERVVGVSGKGYISTPYVVDPKHGVVDLGEQMAYEQLVQLRPDVVLCYGVDDAQSSMTNRMEELGIPYVYLAEYLEEDPLGRAEWMVAIGALMGVREQAEECFVELEQRYQQVCALTEGVGVRPKVMFNTPWNDAWFLPNRESYAVQLVEQAGGTPLYGSEKRGETEVVGMEQAMQLLQKADYWLNVGQATRYEELPVAVRTSGQLMPSVVHGHIYNNNARLTAGGGSDYWEHGVVEPDVILRDLICILHPELLPDHQLVYYRRITTP